MNSVAVVVLSGLRFLASFPGRPLISEMRRCTCEAVSGTQGALRIFVHSTMDPATFCAPYLRSGQMLNAVTAAVAALALDCPLEFPFQDGQ